MDDDNILEQNILEQIDACRPGSEDLREPELCELSARIDDDPRVQQLYARLQRLDVLIGQEIREVPVPEGLAGRLLARLAASEDASRIARPNQQDHDQKDLVSDPVVACKTAAKDVVLANDTQLSILQSSSSHRTRTTSRRTWMAWATAASLLVAGLAWWQLPHRLPTKDAILANAGQLHMDAVQHAASFSPLPGPVGYRPPNLVSGIGDWQNVNFLGLAGVAYQLRKGVASGTLFVFQSSVAGVPGTAPSVAVADPSDRYRGIAVWQQGGLLYVLVVDRQDDYRRFVGTTQRPMA